MAATVPPIDPKAALTEAEPDSSGAPVARRGFALQCPHCGESESLRANLHDTRVLVCTNCEADVTEADVQALIKLWRRALRWLASAPELPTDE